MPSTVTSVSEHGEHADPARRGKLERSVARLSSNFAPMAIARRLPTAPSMHEYSLALSRSERSCSVTSTFPAGRSTYSRRSVAFGSTPRGGRCGTSICL